jgi:hypothetical protein
LLRRFLVGEEVCSPEEVLGSFFFEEGTGEESCLEEWLPLDICRIGSLGVRNPSELLFDNSSGERASSESDLARLLVTGDALSGVFESDCSNDGCRCVMRPFVTSLSDLMLSPLEDPVRLGLMSPFSIRQCKVC